MRPLILCLAIAVLPSLQAGSLTDQLVGHFTFDEGTIQTEVANSVSSAPAGLVRTDGTPAGSFEAVKDGVINGAAAVIPAAIVQFDDPPYGDFPEQSFTFAGWIKCDLPPNEKTRLRLLIAKGRENQRTPGWAFFLRFDDKEGDIQLAFAATDDRSVGFSTYPRIAGFEINTWYHVAVVVDRNENTATLYLNGLQLDAGPLGALGNIGSIDPMAIARWPKGAVPFGGMLDDFALWGRPLSSAEIGEIYTLGKEGKTF